MQKGKDAARIDESNFLNSIFLPIFPQYKHITMNKYCIFFLFLGLFSCTTSNQQAETSSQPQKTNIIYILADDLGYGDLSFNGQQHFQTPNIDKLRAEGMWFSQHYSGSTVCAPSRSAIMTGQHTGHTPIRGNKEVRPEGQHPLPANTVTMAELLKEQGYTTGVFGKWGLGFPGSEGDPNNQGVDEFFGYNCQRLAHHYYPRYLWHNQEKVEFPENAGKGKGLYAPDRIQEETIKFIENNKENPFFLFVTAVIPHAELAAPEELVAKHRGKYEPETQYEGYDEGEKYREGPYESQEECHATFAAMVDYLDQQVGEIMQKVDELGLTENTIIMFSSDNGPHLEGGADPDYFDSNGPLKGYKRDLYEGGIRVPMIARWPGIIASNSSSDHISAFWDLLPTVADIAGMDAPANIDGISFLPTLQGDEQPKHEYLYWEFHERGGRIAIRKGDWKAIKYNYLKAPDAPFELYNLAQDIGEENNIADQHPDVLEEMEEIFKRARTESEVFTFASRAYEAK